MHGEVGASFNNSAGELADLSAKFADFLFKHAEVSYRDTYSWTIYVAGIR